MRHFILFAVFLAVLSIDHPVIAQRVGSQNDNAELKSISGLFKGTWVGSGESSDGTSFESELIFEPIMAERFLRVHNHVRIGGKKELTAMTIYGWQPILKQVVFWVFDKDGTTGEGVATLSDSTLSHEWRTFGGNGEIKEWKSKLIQQGRSLRFELTDMKEGQVFQVVYHKRG